MKKSKIETTLLLLSLLYLLSACVSSSDQQPTDCLNCTKLEQICSKYEGYSYIWGGEFRNGKGGDCSGYVWKVFQDIRHPIPRTTARKYYIYFSNKKTIRDWTNVSCGNVIWWTFEHSRPKGHIGVAVKRPRFWQSGSSGGVYSRKFFEGSYWAKNFDGAKDVLK